MAPVFRRICARRCSSRSCASTMPATKTKAAPGSGLRSHATSRARMRSEEHTSELQSPYDLVCRLLLEKKKTRLYVRHGVPPPTPLELRPVAPEPPAMAVYRQTSYEVLPGYAAEYAPLQPSTEDIQQAC